jgi:hypothetical protein
MIKHHEPNPLAVFNMRKMDFLPPHFQSMLFDYMTEEKNILDWIYENTESRFFLGQTGSQNCIAFENHAELSYFSLMLSQFNKPNSFY